MRYCMYCGRELKSDEVCNCPQSKAYKAKKSENSSKKHTGKTDNAGVNFKVHTAGRNVLKRGISGIFSNLAAFFRQFFADPVYAVSNPGRFDKAESIIVIALEGIVFSLIVFFSYSGMKRNILSVLINALGFKGLDGVKSIGTMLLCILSVTVINFIMYFIITGIFYLEGRFLYKMSSGFWDIASRFAISTVPVTAVGLIGIVVSFFSMTTVLTILMAGFVSSFILNYEGLNSIWNYDGRNSLWHITPSKVMYILAGGYMFYFGIAYFILASLI